MTPAEIRAAIEAKGSDLVDLSVAHGLRKNALTTSLTAKRRLPGYQKIIARFLGLSLHQLWPDHYPPEGHRDGRKDGNRPWAYRPEAFERLLARIEAGERYSAIARTPGVPTETALYGYLKRNPEFARRWRRAMGNRPGTRASHYTDAQITAVLDRVAKGERLTDIQREPGQPTSTAILARRHRDPSLNSAFVDAMGCRAGVRTGKDRLEKMLDGMREGKAYSRMKGLVTPTTVIRLRRTDPIFAQRFEEARAAGRIVITRAASSRKVSPTEMWAIVESAVRQIPEYARDDIRGDLAIALYEGRVSPEGARAATRELMTAWNRQFARRDISMDQEMQGYDRDGHTFGALISDGSFDTTGTGIAVRQGLSW